MKRLLRLVPLALTLLAFAAPSALATEDPACQVEGKSAAELRTMLASPTVNVYCPPGTVDEAEEELANVGGGAPQGAVNEDTAEVSSGALPFTGAEAGVFLALGAVLVLTGVLLRRGGSKPTS